MEWIPLSSLEVSAQPASSGVIPRAFGLFHPQSNESPLASLGVPVAPAHPIQDCRVSNQEMSVTFAANLSLGQIFTGQISGNETGYWLDAMAYNDVFEESPANNNLVLVERFGIGLRVLMRVQSVSGQASISYGMIGAAIDVQEASGSYEVDAFGLGPGALVKILGGVAQSGTLTSDAFYKVNSDVIKNLVVYISKNIDTLKPQRAAAMLQSKPGGDSLDTSRAVLFAMRHVRDGASLQEALSDSDDLDGATIRLVYANMLGNVPDTTKPTRDQSQNAADWLTDQGGK